MPAAPMAFTASTVARPAHKVSSQDRHEPTLTFFTFSLATHPRVLVKEPLPQPLIRQYPPTARSIPTLYQCGVMPTPKLFRGFPVHLLAAVNRTLRTDGAELSTPPGLSLSGLRPQTSDLRPPSPLHFQMSHLKSSPRPEIASARISSKKSHCG